MIEITKEQLLNYDNAGRARILKYIVLGLVKYIGGNMNIEKYLSTEEFKTRGQLVKETGFSDRAVRNAISDLKKTRPVIYNSQTRGYRLAKDIKSFNTVNAAIQEMRLIEHCINDIEARKTDMNMSEKTYIAYLNELEEEIMILQSKNNILGGKQND